MIWWPATVGRLLSTLDEAYQDLAPGELERTLLGAIDDLSRAPRPLSEVSIDPTAVGPLIELASAAEAIRTIDVAGEQVAFSPYFVK
jgi:hypothetical protein